MSKSKGEALFVYQQENGILLARANHFTHPIQVTELQSISTHEINSNPVSALHFLNQSKKGFCEVHFVVSNGNFRHFIHSPENPSKIKSNEYILNIVKEWLGGDKEDFFYQVIGWDKGELVSVDSAIPKSMLISGMKTKSLSQLQAQIVDNGIFPRKLECSITVMLGLIRKLIDSGQLRAPVVMLEIYRDSGLLVILPSEGMPLIRPLESGETSMYEHIKEELSLKDVVSAQKLMYSSTIDLSDIGRQVLSSVFKEIASVVGLYEVDTGQSISQLLMTNLMPIHRWMAELLAKDLGMNVVDLDYRIVGEQVSVIFNENIEWNRKDARILPLIGSMGVL